ncbi:MAG: radical SAM protein [Chloroflexi bacterium]|nr:radical SAM protein [Chloroflexota bacterium]
MTDVILVNPPHEFPKTSERGHRKKGYVLYPPLGILYLAAVLKREGYSVKIIDAVADGSSQEDICHDVGESGARLIGISMTTAQTRGALSLAGGLRERFGDGITIGIGGPHPTADPGFVERFPVFDFAVVGEGETIFPEIVARVMKGESVRGSFQGTSPPDLDALPFPERSLIDPSLYYIEPYGRYIANIHTARGCPFNCVFCSKPVGKRSVKYRSPENILAEIEYCIREFDIKYVLFTDDTFTLDMERAALICEEILRRGIRLTWACETRAELVDRPLLELMRRAGCHEISMGVESGSEYIRQHVIRKRVSDKHLISAFAECHRLGIDANAFCMLGFPGETRENMLETMNFIRRIKPELVGVHLTVPFPGSDIYRQAMAEGKISGDAWDAYARGEISGQPVYVPDGFTRERLEEMQKYVYRKYYYRPGYIWHRLRRDLFSWNSLNRDVRLGLELFQRAGTKTGRP